MKKYFLTAGLLTCVMGFTACEDQLDVDQHGATSSTSFYSNDTECLEGLSALYKYMELGWLLPDMHFGMAISDDVYAGGGQRGNDGAWEEINELRYTAANSKILTLFQTYYETIYRCNLLTSNCNGETTTQKRIVAEAKVIRAFTYLRLASYFGDVPLITAEITDGQYTRPCSTRAEIFAQIEQDLNEAIQSGALLEKSSVNDQLVNVTKQTAQGLLGKAYVYESTFLGTNKWAEARTALDAVISSGKYALVTEDYDDQFHMVGRFSTESMFESNRLYDAQNIQYVSGYSHQRLGWRTEKFNQTQLQTAQKEGWINCSPESYGFFSPSQELYDAFVEVEGEDGWRLNETMRTYKQLAALPLQIQQSMNVYGTAGHFQTKMPSRAEERVQVHKVAQDVVYFRYADVLLLAAEAELPEHGGSQSKCDNYLNQIKTRAREANKPGNYTLTDVQKERRLELCFEGSRYPDLVRWNIIAEAYKDKGKKIPSLHGLYDHSDNNNELHENVNGYNVSFTQTASQGWQDKFKVVPIPQSEIDVNPQVTQAAGW